MPFIVGNRSLYTIYNDLLPTSPGSIEKKTIKPIFHWKLCSSWLPNANESDTNNMKSTWPMREFCVGDPTFSVRVGGNANFSVFRYQHVGIPNAKLWCWGSKSMRGPNANGFVSQWNIDFTF